MQGCMGGGAQRAARMAMMSGGRMRVMMGRRHKNSLEDGALASNEGAQAVSAAAVLAGAGIAAAARFGAAVTVAVGDIGLAVGHFSLLFSLLNSERITI